MRLRSMIAKPGSRRRREEGSTLMLVPAGFLVLMLLAALSVDSAVAYLGQRQLDDALTAAVNDAATAGLSNRGFYQQGSVTLDPAMTVVEVCRSLAAQGDGGLHDLHLAVGVSGPEVTVRATARVDGVFGGIVAGLSTRQVSAQVTAEAQERAGTVKPPPPLLVPATCK
jgi:hypothetical protein